MIAYSYGEQGEFTGTVPCQRNIAVEDEEYLCPGSATMVQPPPIPSGQVACWNGESWVLVLDHRGIWYDKTTGEAYSITDVGASAPHTLSRVQQLTPSSTTSVGDNNE